LPLGNYSGQRDGKAVTPSCLSPSSPETSSGSATPLHFMERGKPLTSKVRGRGEVSYQHPLSHNSTLNPLHYKLNRLFLRFNPTFWRQTYIQINNDGRFCWRQVRWLLSFFRWCIPIVWYAKLPAKSAKRQSLVT